MRVLIDACVLFPTVLREIVIGTAAMGVFTPLWSPRILEEWRCAAAKLGPIDGEIAAAEVALITSQFPDASVDTSVADARGLSLPDPDDVHVLAAAIRGGAGELLTLNIRDFPTNILAEHGILRRHPDEFLLEAFHSKPEALRSVVTDVLERAKQHGIDTSNPRKLLKRARIPRLAKALFQD